MKSSISDFEKFTRNIQQILETMQLKFL